MKPAAPVTTYRTGSSLTRPKDAARPERPRRVPLASGSTPRLKNPVHAQRVPRVLVHLLRRLVVGDDRGDDVGLVADQPPQRTAVERPRERGVERHGGEDGRRFAVRAVADELHGPARDRLWTDLREAPPAVARRAVGDERAV